MVCCDLLCIRYLSNHTPRPAPPPGTSDRVSNCRTKTVAPLAVPRQASGSVSRNPHHPRALPDKNRCAPGSTTTEPDAVQRPAKTKATLLPFYSCIVPSRVANRCGADPFHAASAKAAGHTPTNRTTSKCRPRCSYLEVVARLASALAPGIRSKHLFGMSSDSPSNASAMGVL